MSTLTWEKFLTVRPDLAEWPLVSSRSIWLNAGAVRTILYRAKRMQSAGAMSWLQELLRKDLPSIYRNINFDILMVVPLSWKKRHLQLNFYLPCLAFELAKLIGATYITLPAFPLNWQGAQKKLRRKQRIQNELNNYYPRYFKLLEKSKLNLSLLALGEAKPEQKVFRILLFDDIATTGSTLQIFANSVHQYLQDTQYERGQRTEIWGLTLTYQASQFLVNLE